MSHDHCLYRATASWVSVLVCKPEARLEREQSMSEMKPAEFGETPTVEVRIYRHGELIDTQLCETVDEAAALVASKEETPGIECEVEDLSSTTHDESSLEVGTSDLGAGYPHDAGTSEQT